MKIRHCFFSPFLFEVFSSKIAAHCSDCINPLLTEPAFLCTRRALSLTLLPLLCSVPIKEQRLSAPHRCQWGGESNPLPNTSSELLAPCGENLPPNNAVIDIDGVCCSHCNFLETCFQDCEKPGYSDQRSKPLFPCKTISLGLFLMWEEICGFGKIFIQDTYINQKKRPKMLNYKSEIVFLFMHL